jgi:queuine tRNA-ribosyltransferase
MGVTGAPFRVEASDGRARCGRLRTAHGEVETPAFMAVGTQASVKGCTPEQLRAVGTPVVLGNAFHLALRPGAPSVKRLGGLHRFMGWDGPLLTDSGGFQVFSLAEGVQVAEEGVTFRNPHDGRRIFLGPREAVAIQQDLGADLIMAFDQCLALPASRDETEQALARTLRWARLCREAHVDGEQLLFGIVQGGAEADLRRQAARDLASIGFAGYAIGGLAVGEGDATRHAMVEASVSGLPEGWPRYLMGVGRPEDLMEAVARGVDLFDCVLPTRHGRNASAQTSSGPVNLRNAAFREDPRPLEEGCPCPACARFSRAYLRHLFVAGEMLGPTLVSLHNLAFTHRLMASARTAIRAGRFQAFRAGVLRIWSGAKGLRAGV